jgi:hypothetical protein
MKDAVALYWRLGYYEIAAYRGDLMLGMLYME